ncbi:MAG: flagellar filament capping protein FliD [Halorhodospira sp.]
MVSPLDQMPDMPSKMGVGSGIDTNKMVKDLVQAERAPTEQRYAKREQELEEKISALGQMRGTVNEFQQSLQGLADPDAYSGIEAESSNSEVVGLSAGQEARPGEYQVQVEQLARTQRIATASGAFEDSADPIGTGRLIITDGQGREQAVTIDEEASTLLGIRDAVNEQTEQLRASVVDDGNGPRLAIATEETGQANAIASIRAVQEPDVDRGDLSPLQYNAPEVEGGEGRGLFEQLRPAADAVVTIDGMPITRPENRVEDAIEGATLELKEEGSSRLMIEEQTGLPEENIQRLVEGFNQLRGQLNELSDYDPESEQAGPLQGDPTLRNLVSQLSQAVIDPVAQMEDQPVQGLGELGVRTNRDGTLEVDGERLQQMVAAHPEAVTRLMTDPESGIMSRLEGVLEQAVGRDSMLEMRTEGVERRLDSIADDRERLDRRMERREEQLRDKFSAMDSRVAELNQTSDFLEQRLAGMNGEE